MTKNQRAALKIMAKRNTGAVLTDIGWVWRSDVRLSTEAADAVLDRLECIECGGKGEFPIPIDCGIEICPTCNGTGRQ